LQSHGRGYSIDFQELKCCTMVDLAAEVPQLDSNRILTF
jgi:hypothetical protein